MALAVSERDLRCWGSAPPLPLAPQTQDRLCRTPSHARCEIFLAAQQARVTALAADRVSPQQLDGRFGLLVRPTPLILDRPVSLAAALPSRKPRTFAGFAVAALAALVLAIVLVALLQGGGTGPQSTPTPLVAVGGSPSPATGSGALGSPAARRPRRQPPRRRRLIARRPSTPEATKRLGRRPRPDQASRCRQGSPARIACTRATRSPRSPRSSASPPSRSGTSTTSAIRRDCCSVRSSTFPRRSRHGRHDRGPRRAAGAQADGCGPRSTAGSPGRRWSRSRLARSR